MRNNIIKVKSLSEIRNNKVIEVCFGRNKQKNKNNDKKNYFLKLPFRERMLFMCAD
jgi:hypothetical protein